MRQKKSTRKALLSSAISLVLCLAMLIGTTFAWFTDSVTSTNNIIKSGNLKVKLEYSKDMATWEEVDADTNVFKEDGLWEPGYTEVVYLRVSNVGSLALKYNLGINVASEKVGTNVAGETFKLSDYIQFGVEKDVTEAYDDRSEAVGAVADSSVVLNAGYTTSDAIVANAPEKVYAMVVYMPETVGNEANHNGEDVPEINLGINLFATQLESESDSFGSDYDAIVKVVGSAEEAQKAFDNAVKGTTIYLTPNVDYGVLYLRPSANEGVTKEVDWQGNNYRYETYSCFENVKVVGAKDATIDAVVIEGGTYYNTAHSQDETYPVMLSLVELKNVVFEDVTFTGKGGYDPQGYGNVINLTGHIKVDGLTLKDCVLENESNDARLIYKTEATTTQHVYTYEGETYTFMPTLKDITVTGCTLNGGYMGLELRETENLTITNNIFNVADRNILLPANTGCTYTGAVTITGNVSNYAQERFVRATSMNDAVVTITDNTINYYVGKDADFIKVEGAVNATIERNTITYAKGVANAEALKVAITNAENDDIIVILNDIVVTDKWDNRYGGKTNKAVTINGLNHTLKFTGEVNDGFNYHSVFRFEGAATVQNLTFDLSEVAGSGSWLRAISASSDLTVDNCTFIGSDNYSKDNAVVIGDTNASAQINASVSITNCTFSNWRRGVSDNENAKEVKEVEIKNNTFKNASVYVSAYENVNFTGNVMKGSLVNIRSYTAPSTAKAVVTGNTLDAKVESVLGATSKKYDAANVTAQEGILVYTIE